MFENLKDAEQAAPPDSASASRIRLLERHQAPLTPSQVPSGRQPTQGRSLPGRRQEPNGQLIEATGYAMHQLGGARMGSLAVLSSIRGEGRTSVAAATAYAQARDYGRSTLLIDADFDGPTLASRFGLEQSPGVAEVVRGHAGLEEAARQLDDGLSVMTAGEVGGSPARLARELASSGLLGELQVDFEVVVADLPALLQSTTGPLLAELFDNRVLVVRAGVTPIARVREAAALLPEDPVVMLNGANTSLPRWLRRFFS